MAYFVKRTLQKKWNLYQNPGADFKYDNNFFKIIAQKYLNKAFLVPDLDIFVFSQNFAIRQI